MKPHIAKGKRQRTIKHELFGMVLADSVCRGCTACSLYHDGADWAGRSGRKRESWQGRISGQFSRFRIAICSCVHNLVLALGSLNPKVVADFSAELLDGFSKLCNAGRYGHQRRVRPNR